MAGETPGVVIDVNYTWGDTLITVATYEGKRPVVVTGYDLVQNTTLVNVGNLVTLYDREAQ